MRNVLCVGFVCGDLVLRPVDGLPPLGGNRFVDQASLTIGGCAANAAVALARLQAQAGGRVAVAGRVGMDGLGQLLRQTLADADVDSNCLIPTAEVGTAINTALISTTGERSFFVFPGACEFLIPEDVPDPVLAGFHHLHLGAVGALPGLAAEAGASLAQRARAVGLTVSLDITLNPPRNTAADVGPLLPHVDLFLPNLTEAQATLGEGDLDTLLSLGLAEGVRLMGIKLGEAGCALATADERVRVPAFDVQAAGATIVDTCGAGDAWRRAGTS